MCVISTHHGKRGANENAFLIAPPRALFALVIKLNCNKRLIFPMFFLIDQRTNRFDFLFSLQIY